MSWIIGILSVLAAIFYGLYQLGPGINKRREEKKRRDWTRKWEDLFKNNKYK